MKWHDPERNISLCEQHRKHRTALYNRLLQHICNALKKIFQKKLQNNQKPNAISKKSQITKKHIERPNLEDYFRWSL